MGGVVLSGRETANCDMVTVYSALLKSATSKAHPGSETSTTFLRQQPNQKNSYRVWLKSGVTTPHG